MVKQIQNKEFLGLTKQIGINITGRLSGRIVQKMMKIKKQIATCLKLKNRINRHLDLPLNTHLLGKFKGEFLIMKKNDLGCILDQKYVLGLSSRDFSKFELKANRICGQTIRKTSIGVNNFIKYCPKINISKIILEKIIFLTQFQLMNYDPCTVFEKLNNKDISFLSLFYKENAFSWIFFEKVEKPKYILIHLFVTNILTVHKGFGKEIMRTLDKLYPEHIYIVQSDTNAETVKFYESIGFKKETENNEIGRMYKNKLKNVDGTVIMFCKALAISTKNKDYSRNYFSSTIIFDCCSGIRRFFEVLFFILHLIIDHDLKSNIFLKIRDLIDLIYVCSCSENSKLNSAHFMLGFIKALEPITENIKKLSETDLKDAENKYKVGRSEKDTRISSDWFRFFLNN